MKKPEEKKIQAGKYKRDKHPDPEWETRWPNLCEYLLTVMYDDGSLREPSGISVKIQEGRWIAILNDPTVTRSLYRVADTLPEVFDALEVALSTGRADWRVWKAEYGQKRRGK